ncbi:MAG TPA: GNAT family N-acetyltransferase [Candidatus Acidoferrales bacterium]|nr:GNAT family N-acetyltransferase [Candidatus Acidoferrales bacterium]
MPESPKLSPPEPPPDSKRSFTILRATSANLGLARQAITEVDGRTVLDEAALVEFISDPARYLLLVIESGRVIGSLNGYALQRPYRREPQFLLYEVGVRPECRNRGVGKALVAKFISEARSAGAFEVWVITSETNEAAMAMYESCGLGRETQDEVAAMLNMALSGGKQKPG